MGLTDGLRAMGMGWVNDPNAKAVKVEMLRMSDFDDEMTYRVFLTNEEGTADYGELDYFNEDYDAEEFAENYAKQYDLNYLGIGDE
jgi:hypothetical protein